MKNRFHLNLVKKNNECSLGNYFDRARKKQAQKLISYVVRLCIHSLMDLYAMDFSFLNRFLSLQIYSTYRITSAIEPPKKFRNAVEILRLVFQTSYMKNDQVMQKKKYVFFPHCSQASIFFSACKVNTHTKLLSKMINQGLINACYRVREKKSHSKSY